LRPRSEPCSNWRDAPSRPLPTSSRTRHCDGSLGIKRSRLCWLISPGPIGCRSRVSVGRTNDLVESKRGLPLSGIDRFEANTTVPSDCRKTRGSRRSSREGFRAGEGFSMRAAARGYGLDRHRPALKNLPRRKPRGCVIPMGKARRERCLAWAPVATPSCSEQAHVSLVAQLDSGWQGARMAFPVA